MSNQSGLWERTRQAAYAEIERTAIRLFLEQGFEATTIEQIATAAGISRRSFFRYFGTKEDILLGRLASQGPELQSALEARPMSEGPWEALRAALSALKGLGATKSEELAISKMLHETPSLRARSTEKHLGWQKLLVPNIRLRLGLDPEDELNPSADAIVACALTCLDVAGEIWARSEGTLDLLELADAAVAAVRR
jgi:AcrR family transcriptional regulator